MNRIEEQVRAERNVHARRKLLLHAGTKILREAKQKARRRPRREKPTPRANGWHALQDLPRLMWDKKRKPRLKR